MAPRARGAAGGRRRRRHAVGAPRRKWGCFPAPMRSVRRVRSGRQVGVSVLGRRGAHA